MEKDKLLFLFRLTLSAFLSMMFVFVGIKTGVFLQKTILSSPKFLDLASKFMPYMLLFGILLIQLFRVTRKFLAVGQLHFKELIYICLIGLSLGLLGAFQAYLINN